MALGPFDDGIKDDATRSRLRAQAWQGCYQKKKLPSWTEKRCNACGQWNHKDRQMEWCEHFREPIPTESDAPNVQVFKPYFNPNIQRGGAWVDSRSKERECMKVNRKEWKH